MSSDVVVEARGLGKAYPIYRRPEDRLKQLLWGRRRRFYEEFWAVRNIDLRVHRSETIGIIGRNGSGKSTLLQMICGTLRPSAGDVRVLGRIAAMLELGSGFNPEFTGRENARVGASVLGLRAEEIEARFDSIAAFADIGTFIDQPMKQYSNGMHARLAFAVCANVDADVLVVDEILSVGDAAFQQKCMRFLNRFRLHGTMLFVSHDSGAITKLCDKVLWLEDGEVRGFGEAKEMLRLYLAAQAEEAVDDAVHFRLSSRSQRSIQFSDVATPLQTIAEPAAIFDFDPEDDWQGSGDGTVESVELRATDGSMVRVAAGGEEIELRFTCRALRSINHPVVAYAWRDRLGQILFSDDTFLSNGNAPANIAEGKRFLAHFVCRLPYLSSGPYSIEAFLFSRTSDDFVPLARKRDSLIIHVQSRHIFQQGLLNIGMRALRLRSVPPFSEQFAADAEETQSGEAGSTLRAGSDAAMGRVSG